MARGRPPKRVPDLCRRKDGRLYVTDPATGKQVYFETEIDYERWRQTFVRRGAAEKKPTTRKRRTAPPGSRLTVSQLCEAYLDFAEEYYQKEGQPTGHLSTVRLSIKNWVELCGRELADEMRAADAERIQEHMIEADYARTMINEAVSCVRRILRWGVRKEWVEGGTLERFSAQPPLKKHRTKARERPKVGPVDLETIRAMEPELSKTIRAMIWVQYYGGMRPGEVCRLTAGQIDKTGEVWEYLPARYKTEHHHEDDGGEVGRRVFFGPQAQKILQPFMERSTGPDDPIFRTERPYRGRRRAYITARYDQAIARACRRAKIKHWHPGQLRHAMATHIRKKYGAEAARVYLGHTKLATTEVYAERDFDLARKIAAEMG